MARRVAEAVEAMHGELVSGSGTAEWRGAAIDSRQIAGGELFFALPGASADGHDFAADAVERGAAAVVVGRPVELPAGGSAIVVGDPYEALHALTRHVRRQTPEHLVALTGSAGKTTTKELLAAMLARRFRVAKSPGNLNNLLGFPLSLLAAPEDTEWMVAEMGMSTPGELAEVSRLGRPDVAMILNVGAAHLESFESVRAIAEAKSEILAGLKIEGLLIWNADDPEVTRIAKRYRERHRVPAVSFGRSPEAMVRAVGVRPRRPFGSFFELEAGGSSVTIELPLHGDFQVDNCLAAAACAHALGVPLAAIAEAVADVRPAPMRGEIHVLPGAILIDDSYNSNPEALTRALRSAAQLPGQRRLAVLGEMLELGPTGEELHREAGRVAADCSFTVIAVGELGRALADAAAERGAETSWYPDAAAAAEAAAAEVGDYDLVLVKGSRGVGLEVVVDRLTSSEGG